MITPKTCSNCKFWSDLMARWSNDDGMRAMCLNDNGPKFQRYMNRVGKCEAHVAGLPIDGEANYPSYGRGK